MEECQRSRFERRSALVALLVVSEEEISEAARCARSLAGRQSPQESKNR